jgi:DNA-binding IclR family transcriptional regulator
LDADPPLQGVNFPRRYTPERRLKLADLVTETGLVRRTVQNALVSLIEAGVLHRLGAGPGTRYQLIF